MLLVTEEVMEEGAAFHCEALLRESERETHRKEVRACALVAFNG